MSTTRTHKWRTMTAAVAALLLAIAVGAAQRSESPEVLYQRALDKEVADGDYTAAIDLYKKVVDAPGVSPALAAQALVHMGQCYQRQGNNAEAQKAYEQVASKYASQVTFAAEAQTRLKALLARQAQTATAPKALTLVLSSASGGAVDLYRDRLGWTTVTPDGQYLLGAGFQGVQLFDLANRRLLIGAGLSQRDLSNLIDSPPEPGHMTVLSSNGKQVAFRYANGQIRIQPFSSEGQASDLGKSKVLLENDAFADGLPFGWSADDREVFALLTGKDHTYKIAAISVSNGAVRIIRSLDWRWPNRLSLSPDGRYIAYDAPLARDSSNRDIFLAPTNGGSETPIVQNPARDALPVWTPDGKAIVFVSDRSGAVGLWVAQLADGKPQGPARAIRPQVGPLWPIGFTRDGSFYYNTGGRIGPNDLYTAEVDLSAGTVSATQIVGRRGANKSPAYSPDGKRLAYLSQQNASFFEPNGPHGGWTIIVRTLASGEEREIPSVAAGQSGLSWFPDGQSLVYTGPSDLSGRSSLHRIDLNTGKELITSATSVDASSPTVVSPDGKKVYYSVTPMTQVDGGARNTGRVQAIIAYEVDAQREVELFRGKVRGGRLDLSPDGNQLVFWVTDVGFGGNFRLMAASGGLSRVLPSSVPGSVVQWSADGKSLLLQASGGPRGQRPQQQVGTLWRLPTDGGEPQSIGTTTYPPIAAIRPDGKQIARTGASAINQRSEIWVDPNILTDIKR